MMQPHDMPRHYDIATLNINHEPVRVYVYQGRVPLHCGICGKQLIEGDEYTRHQSPTRWSLSGEHWDEVEIGLRRTSVKPYTACSQCYGFTYNNYQDAPLPHDTDSMCFVRLDENAKTGQLILEELSPVTLHASPVGQMQYEDLDATVKLPVPIWKLETLVEVKAVTKSYLEELAGTMSVEDIREMKGDDTWLVK